MKPLILLGVLVALALVGSNLQAADIPQSQLAAIGLGNMKAMSHATALEVRGKGFGESSGWSDDRRGWNSWNEHSKHDHHHQHHQAAHCQPASHCQPGIAGCHIAGGPCGGFGGAVGIH